MSRPPFLLGSTHERPVPGESALYVWKPDMTSHQHTPDTLPLIFVIGATNAGKSTLLDTVRSYAGVGMIEVGKMFRAKYPPEHFKGHANPAHTQVEAWQMFLDSRKAWAEKGARVAFVDGQPRDLEQCKMALALPNPKRFIHLWAPISVREERARKRDHDPVVPEAENEKLKLSLARVTGDLPKLYDVVQHIKSAHYHIRDPIMFDIDTTSDSYTSFFAANTVVRQLIGEDL